MDQWRHEIDVENQPEVVEVENDSDHNEKLAVEAHSEEIGVISGYINECKDQIACF